MKNAVIDQIRTKAILSIKNRFSVIQEQPLKILQEPAPDKLNCHPNTKEMFVRTGSIIVSCHSAAPVYMHLSIDTHLNTFKYLPLAN